jgi:eukaryotic-like serine/threonine-protein kinase
MTPKPNPEEIFNKAVEITDPSEQAAFLEQACAGDEKLRAEVDALLKWNQEAGSFLDVAGSDGAATLDSAALPDASGTVVGRYKLLEKIGEGGMATVYMAEQKRPIRRRVALKIIKLGMDTKQVIGRFEAERQALAMMDHPNIAKVLDAGTTETGRPYFVMELVKGLPMTGFCDSNHLTTQERLDLFISVCQAVQHAHQRGIIHRDIKPTNILVTLHDGKPVVKVIDFGIAKAVNQQLTEKTVFTRFSQMIGTPEYMSPEQAEMSGLDIDTRTDVFSLGVLLYELLTGTTPFDSEYLLGKGYNEMQRIIREEEPIRPSTKVSTLGDTLTEVAKHRHTSPEVLCKLIRSDLDWIIMKTLEKDRQRRYESVSELAADVQRHLHNETVLAGRPSAVHRMQKFIKRNKGLVIGTVVVLTVVMLAAIVSSVLAVKATKAEKAQAELRKKAEESQAEAEQAQKKAVDLSKQQEEDLYFNCIKLAHQVLQANRPVHALELLNSNKCPGKLRNWEWYYLHRKSHFHKMEPLEFDDKVISLDISADGSKQAVFLENGKVVLQDLVAGKELFSVQVRNSPEQMNEDFKSVLVRWVAFCPDGKHIAAAGDDHNLSLISKASGSIIQTIPGHKHTVTKIEWSPDGFLLASLSQDNTVRLWNQRDDTSVEITFDSKLNNMAFSGDGRFLFVCRWDGHIDRFKVEDILRGKTTSDGSYDLEMHPYGITVSPDGQRVAVGLWDGRILLFNSECTVHEDTIEGHTAHLDNMAFTQDGTRLVSISTDMTVRLWDVKTGHEVLVIDRMDVLNLNQGLDYYMNFVAFRKNDSELLIGDRAETVTVYEASPLVGPQDSISEDLSGHTMPITNVGYHPDGNQVIASGIDGTVRLWDVIDDSNLPPLYAGDMGTWSGQFDPSGKWITAWCCQKGLFYIKVWQSEPPYNELFRWKYVREPMAVTFSHDSKYLIVGGEEHKLDVFDWRLSQRVHGLEGQNDYIVSLTTSPDGRYLASAGFGGSVWLWDATRLTEEQEGYEVYTGGWSFMRVGFSPDSKKLTMGGREGDIVILDVESKNAQTIRNAHGDIVHGVGFSPDGKYIASGSSDKTVRIWDAETGDPVDLFLEHKGRVINVAFSPNGKQVVSSGIDTKVRIWTPSLD